MRRQKVIKHTKKLSWISLLIIQAISFNSTASDKSLAMNKDGRLTFEEKTISFKNISNLCKRFECEHKKITDEGNSEDQIIVSKNSEKFLTINLNGESIYSIEIVTNKIDIKSELKIGEAPAKANNLIKYKKGHGGTYFKIDKDSDISFHSDCDGQEIENCLIKYIILRY